MDSQGWQDCLYHAEICYLKALDQLILKYLIRQTNEMSLVPYGSGILDAILSNGVSKVTYDSGIPDGTLPDGIPKLRNRYVLVRIVSEKEFIDSECLHLQLETLLSSFEEKNPYLLLATDASRESHIVTDLEHYLSNERMTIWTRRDIEMLYENERSVNENEAVISSKESKFTRWIIEKTQEKAARIEHVRADKNRHLLNNALISEIRRKFDDGNIVFFLGAGITKDAGGPSWKDLLAKLRLRFLSGSPKSRTANEDIRRKVSKALSLKQESMPLIAALELESAFGDKFLEKICNILYEKQDSADTNHEQISPGPIHKQIARLCAEHSIPAIITYNWDNLLEQELDKQDVSHKVIYDNCETGDSDALPIYHVHGYLPQERSLSEIQSSGHVVFSEKKYHKLYRDTDHWANKKQLSLLENYSCFFIGLSMTDPNQRRIMQKASSVHPEPAHYTFQSRFTSNKIQNLLGLPDSQLNPVSVKTVTRTHHILESKALTEYLKTNPIWIDKYDEIEKNLKNM